ncbi:MAG: ankyrin repeat domain-containing protein [Bryobacterales bacterium]|nr:ankyrin repeat domain-containing protein [Bryobacterales bacterium]
MQLFRRCLSEEGPDRWGAPSGNTILHNAAANTNNPTVVRLLLDADADPNAMNDRGETPLHRGATNSNPVVISHLLSAGANPNAMDNDGYTPLHYAAAQSGNARAVTRLLGAGADPLVESNDGRTPLHSALRYAADRGVVLELVEAGAAENLTFLQMAVLEGDSAAVSLLLAGAGDPNAADAYGWSALHFAVPLAGSGVVSALLAAGADPNARTVGGATGLHLAARQATLDVVANLVDAGGDPNARDGDLEEARTPLHYAALSSDDPSVVLVLLRAGADPSVRDANGQRPVDFARENDEITGSSAYRRLLASQPNPLVAGRSATGNLASADGVRWGGQYYDEWSYSAMVGQRIVVTMESEQILARLRVLRSDGTELQVEEDVGYSDDSGFNTEVSFRAPTTGQYTILATSAIAEETGRYTIRVERSAGGVGPGPNGNPTGGAP